jgi:hypothetical protein
LPFHFVRIVCLRLSLSPEYPANAIGSCRNDEFGHERALQLPLLWWSRSPPYLSQVLLWCYSFRGWVRSGPRFCWKASPPSPHKHRRFRGLPYWCAILRTTQNGFEDREDHRTLFASGRCIGRLCTAGNKYRRLIGADQSGDQVEQRRSRAHFVVGMLRRAAQLSILQQLPRGSLA